jgi:hypothetical protein
MDRFKEKERELIIESIILDIKSMNIYELESLKSISSNIGRFESFINGLRFFVGRDF